MLIKFIYFKIEKILTFYQDCGHASPGNLCTIGFLECPALKNNVGVQVDRNCPTLS
jgi:hypothetical protein